MNIDLLKKLTRLANNNPNENEANMAARKVCIMLQEGNWELKQKIFNPSKKQEEYYNSNSVLSDLIKNSWRYNPMYKTYTNIFTTETITEAEYQMRKEK